VADGSSTQTRSEKTTPRAHWVVCWMRRAVRGVDQPALDAAAWLARTHHLPLVTIFELSPSQPGANIRHWRFALQGAADMHRDLVARGFPAPILHAIRQTEPASALDTLASYALAVVTDSVPTPAATRQLNALHKSSGVPVFSFDCTTPCVNAQGQVVPADWTPLQSWEPDHAPSELDTERGRRRLLGVHTIAPSSEAIERTLRECELHAALPPLTTHSDDVAHGGRLAGEERWTAWLADRTHMQQSAVSAQGASLLSIGLQSHIAHGHMSPMAMAVEAAHAANAGHQQAASILHELLVDRPAAARALQPAAERMRLSTAFTPAESKPALTPANQAHATPDMETLWRGRTSSEPWNTVQRTLYATGSLKPHELDLWCGQMLQWTGDRSTALEKLVALADRCSRVSDDPSWLMGLVRTLESDSPSRINTVEVQPQTGSRGKIGCTPKRVGVVGAGIAGLVAARELADAGLLVDLFDRGRSPGGRASTKRISLNEGEIIVDHGCQYITPIDRRFTAAMESWHDRGVLTRWPGLIGVREEFSAQITPVGTGATRFVGAGAMSDLARELAATCNEGVTIHCSTTMTRARNDAGSWHLHDEQGHEHGPYDALLIAAPPEQAARLFEDTPAVVLKAQRVRMGPCWAGIFALSAPLETDYDGLYAHGTPVLYAARDSAKPGRELPEGIAETWIVHMAEGWSEQHIDHPAEDMLQLVQAAFASALGTHRLEVAHAIAHRWKFARCRSPLDEACLFDNSISLGLCGDWCLGTRAESAYLSAMAATGRFLEHLLS
jgi:renalase